MREIQATLANDIGADEDASRMDEDDDEEDMDENGEDSGEDENDDEDTGHDEGQDDALEADDSSDGKTARTHGDESEGNVDYESSDSEHEKVNACESQSASSLADVDVRVYRAIGDKLMEGGEREPDKEYDIDTGSGKGQGNNDMNLVSRFLSHIILVSFSLKLIETLLE